MKILMLLVCLGALGALVYNLFKKDDSSNNNGQVGGGGYTGVNDGVEGELPKDNIR